jgi:dipeptidyl aminopeptidase/acylaminoacyl peptidase
LAGILPASAGFDTRSPERTEPGSFLNRGNAALPELEVAAIVNWAGVADLESLVTEPNLRGYAVTWLGSQDNRESMARRISPLTYIREGFPPVLTLHGDMDVCVPYEQALGLQSALNKFGVANKLHTIEGKEHFDFSNDEMKEAFGVIDQFLSKYVM